MSALPLGPGANKVHLESIDDPRKAAVSVDGRYVAIANWEAAGAMVWEVATGRKLASLPIGRFGVIEFSPDNRWLASTPGGVQLWRTGDWKLDRELHAAGTTPHGLGIAFSPDSRALAIGQPNGVLRLADPHTGQDWARIRHPRLESASIIAFTPDNHQIVTLSLDQQSPGRIWDIRDLRMALRKRGLDWPDEVLTQSPRLSSVWAPMKVVWDDGGLLRRLNPNASQDAVSGDE